MKGSYKSRLEVKEKDPLDFYDMIIDINSFSTKNELIWNIETKQTKKEEQINLENQIEINQNQNQKSNNEIQDKKKNDKINLQEKNKKEYSEEKETSLAHLIEKKKYEKNIKIILDDYLDKYRKDCANNFM